MLVVICLILIKVPYASPTVCALKYLLPYIHIEISAFTKLLYDECVVNKADLIKFLTVMARNAFGSEGQFRGC